ncbi:hypothetical protein LXL04_015645 [Taraxacum kok-saghyz]
MQEERKEAEKCRLRLAKMCIKDNRPFSIVDDEGFKEYSWELNPEFIKDSRSWGTRAMRRRQFYSANGFVLENRVTSNFFWKGRYPYNDALTTYFRSMAKKRGAAGPAVFDHSAPAHPWGLFLTILPLPWVLGGGCSSLGVVFDHSAPALGAWRSCCAAAVVRLFPVSLFSLAISRLAENEGKITPNNSRYNEKGFIFLNHYMKTNLGSVVLSKEDVNQAFTGVRLAEFVQGHCFLDLFISHLTEFGLESGIDFLKGTAEGGEAAQHKNYLEGDAGSGSSLCRVLEIAAAQHNTTYRLWLGGYRTMKEKKRNRRLDGGFDGGRQGGRTTLSGNPATQSSAKLGEGPLDLKWRVKIDLVLFFPILRYMHYNMLYMIDASYGAYFRTEAEEEVEGSIKKRKRKPRVVGAPSGVDWDVTRNMISYLKIFSDVTTKISGSKYVTLNIFFFELVKMQATIMRMTLTQGEQKKKMAISMKTKYDKYWDNVDNMNYLLYVAVVLDPRNKLAYVSYCIELIHGQGTEKNKEMMGKVTKTLDELFNHYKDTIFGEKSSISEMDIDLELEFDKLDDGSEVEIYLGDAREKRDQKFDLLGWLKTNSIKFPILSKLARNVLAMPISTVASESAFSTGGRVIDKYRSSLNPETAEALICAQDWIRCTRVDLELGCSMKNKDIDEFNE